uniref:Uncharacterized protein n=1 Tax=Opuntia streptacantha TaxID=393608 RepID=A0A7C9DL21_OPUST
MSLATKKKDIQLYGLTGALGHWPPPLHIEDKEAPGLNHKDAHGLRANANPTFADFSMALVSTSAEIVTSDLGRHSCWIRALALPKLLMRAFKLVNGSIACWAPRVMVFSLVEKLCVTSAPTAELLSELTLW